MPGNAFSFSFGYIYHEHFAAGPALGTINLRCYSIIDTMHHRINAISFFIFNEHTESIVFVLPLFCKECDSFLIYF